MVIQSASQGEWSWEGASEQEEQHWAAFVQEPLLASASAIVGLAGRMQMAPGIALLFSLVSPHEHHEYGSAEEQLGVGAKVHLSAPTLSASNVEKLNSTLAARSNEWQEEGVSSLFLFDLLATAQTLLADFPALAQSRISNRTVRGLDTASAVSSNVELARALFWSHHLVAPSKLKDFNNWCPELRVWGIVRVGYPGYLCFEGEVAAIDEIVRRVKALQWHALQLRIHHTWTYTDHAESRTAPVEQALLSCPFAQHHPDNTRKGADEKVRTGCQVIESLGALVSRLRGCGLVHEEVTEALGIRVSNG